MKNNILFYKNPVSILILIGVLILTSLFYWYEWRPSQIRKECHVSAKAKAWTYDTVYKSCLHAKGLQKYMFTNPIFWMLVGVCLIGYFMFRYGMVIAKSYNNELEFIGGITILTSFVLVLILVNWKAIFALLGLFWIVVTPIVEITISSLQKRLYKTRK